MRPGYTHSVVHNSLILESLTNPFGRMQASVAFDTLLITVVILSDAWEDFSFSVQSTFLNVVTSITPFGFLIDWDVS